MVKKLFKYEIISYLRTLLPFNLILLAVACFTRFIQIFESDFFVYEIIYNSSFFTYCVTVIACFSMVYVKAITHFYKNLYTAEGYLSFTLPVTPAQHIFVKLFTALLFAAVTFVTTVASFAILTAGELGIELVKAGAFLMKKFVEFAGVNSGFYIAEAVVFILVSLCSSFLLYYTCISLGQLAKKNRILAAFGVYFGFYLIEQVFGTLLMIAMIMAENVLDMEKIMMYITENIKIFIHIGLIGGIVIAAALSVLYFFINRFVMSKKLNLE